MQLPVLIFPALLIISVISITSAHEDINISPSDMDRTIFQGGNFRKTCRYTGAESISELQVLHNGLLIDQVSEAASIMLDVTGAHLIDAGPYTCRVILNDLTSINASMGILTVVDINLITAPVDQYVVAGNDIMLECSFHDPDQIYGTVIITIRQGSQITNIINDASVEDEGEYECDITLITESASTLLPITLHVFTPIRITDHPMNYQELVGVQEASFTIDFTGRESQNIDVRWFHNGIILYDTPDHHIITIFSEELMVGNTTIHFPEMDRSNSGVYRVVVSTDFGDDVIDREHRRQEESFQVDITVPPPDPAGFTASVVAEHHVELIWDLPYNHPDENVDQFQLEITFPNGSTANSLTLNKTARSVSVNVFPGVRYEAQLFAKNIDGLGQSNISFVTPPAAPYVTFFEARRLNETHFNISISLLYTGGGDTITFSVYFREQNTIEWSTTPIMIVVLDSVLALGYHGVVTGNDIRGKGPLEFELRVENGLGFMDRTGSVLEISDPPGAPTTPMITEKSDTSVTLDFTLPEDGTPPFISIVLEFSEPTIMERNFSGNYMPGQTVKKQLRDLSPLTVYSLKARAVNYAGNGLSSDTIKFVTDESQPTVSPTPTPDESSMSSLLPLLVGAAGGGVIVVLVTSVCISVCCYCCCKKRKEKKNYIVGKNTKPRDEESALDTDKDTHQRKDQSIIPTILPSNTLDKQHPIATSNPYIMVQHRGVGPPSIASSSSPSSKKRLLERGNNQASSSTLNSGGSATQDSYNKRQQDVLSSGSSNIQLSSLQSSQQGYQTSRDSLGFRRQKVINPSISSSETTTETTELSTSFLHPQVDETYSFQSMPFIPEGSSYSSLAYSIDQSQTHYVSDV